MSSLLCAMNYGNNCKTAFGALTMSDNEHVGELKTKTLNGRDKNSVTNWNWGKIQIVLSLGKTRICGYVLGLRRREDTWFLYRSIQPACLVYEYLIKCRQLFVLSLHLLFLPSPNLWRVYSILCLEFEVHASSISTLFRANHCSMFLSQPKFG